MCILFHPQEQGELSALIEITSNDADMPSFWLPVSGLGGEPDVNHFLESGGQFHNVPLGSSKSLQMQVVNQGGCALTLTGMVQAPADDQRATVKLTV